MAKTTKGPNIGGLVRGVPEVRFRRHRTPRSIGAAFFGAMGAEKPEHIEGWADFRQGMVDMGVWAFAATRETPPVIHYWAAKDVEPLHLAYVLGHEVGHVSGKKLRSRRNAWREELRADEYGAAAFLALKHVLRRTR